MATEQITLPKKSRRSSLLEKYFYFGMSLLVAVVVIYGFSHTVKSNLLQAVPPRPWVLWLHGTVFSTWVMFFIFQSALIRTHNVKLHRRTGWFGVGLGVLMQILGISTAIVMDRFDFLHFHGADFRTFFAVQMCDILSFTTVFWLAIYWRRKPEFHRRLILIATCVLTSAAFGRFPMLPLQWCYIGVDALILLGVVRDLVVNRRIHVVYRYALPALIIVQTLAIYLWRDHPAWWVRVTTAIIG
jgi:hypothetical protein